MLIKIYLKKKKQSSKLPFINLFSVWIWAPTQTNGFFLGEQHKQFVH